MQLSTDEIDNVWERTELAQSTYRQSLLRLDNVRGLLLSNENIDSGSHLIFSSIHLQLQDDVVKEEEIMTNMFVPLLMNGRNLLHHGQRPLLSAKHPLPYGRHGAHLMVGIQ